ncbi:hypothetical protein GQ53DRAFT_858282, partial [Thozetella sp. PMI_491]
DLPSCSLCVRLEKTCRYPPDPKIPDHSAVDHQTLLHRIRDLEQRLGDVLPNLGHESDDPTIQADESEKEEESGSSSMFPRAFFLDTEFFAPLPRSFLAPRLHMIPEVLDQIGSEALTICNIYLARVHTWFPLISQKRLFQQATSLLLSMKLVESSRKDNTEDDLSRLYDIARNQLRSLEDASATSLGLLQSTLLIALYELGHGIFPAAYFTIGRAARLASLMGLADRRNSTQLFKAADTWTLREEERRAWWATFILERIINVGPTGLPLAVPEPAPDALFPTADAHWNKGDIGPSEAVFTQDFSRTTSLGPFARLCQASHALSMVLLHRNTRCERIGRATTLAGALQLHSTLVSLDSYIVQRINSNSISLDCITELAICCSARMLLYNMYGCNEPDLGARAQERIALETEMQAVSLDGLRQVVEHRATTVARFLRSSDDTVMYRVSPLVVECLYTAASVAKWFVKENTNVGMVITLQALTDALRIVSRRWDIAGHFLEMLQAAEY